MISFSCSGDSNYAELTPKTNQKISVPQCNTCIDNMVICQQTVEVFRPMCYEKKTFCSKEILLLKTNSNYWNVWKTKSLTDAENVTKFDCMQQNIEPDHSVGSETKEF